MITLKTRKVGIGPALKAIVKLCYFSDLSVLLVGASGIGKTEIIRQIANELEIDCVVMDLSILEPVDLTGLPVDNGDTVTYHPPDFLPKTRGIFFLDELNRASPQMLKASLQLLSARRLNQYELPCGCLPVAAVNPQDNENYDTNQMDDAMLARFVIIEVEPSVAEWVKWAETANVHEAVLNFVRVSPGIFDGRMSNPRAWTKVSTLLHTFSCGAFDNDTLQAAIEGCVGVALATAFIATLRIPKSIKLPDPADIVFKYKKVRDVVQKSCASGNTSVVSSICHSVALYLQNPQTANAVKASAPAMANLVQFHSDLPAEFRTQFAAFAPWAVAGGH